MEIKDLRIGNIVNDEDNQPMYIAGLWPVNGGKQYRFIDSAGNTGDISKICSGIPLTEELLLKMGFEKNVETDTWFLHIKQPISKHNFSFIQVSLLVTNDTYFDVYIDNNFIMICEFVHDLQNIVWLLGKKELTLS